MGHMLPEACHVFEAPAAETSLAERITIPQHCEELVNIEHWESTDLLALAKVYTHGGPIRLQLARQIMLRECVQIPFLCGQG